MIITQKTNSLLTLEAFLSLSETKPASEYIKGEIHQKPMPQGEHSLLQMQLGTAINHLANPQKIAYAFPELRCTFGGRSLVPDLAIFRWERIPKTSEGKIANKFEIYPDWTIEILSPEQSTNKVIEKILFCLEQGTELGWLLDPKDESVMIFQPNQLPKILYGLTFLPVLDGLENNRLTVQSIFEGLKL